MVLVLVEGLQQNVELAQDLVGGYCESTLVVELQNTHQFILDMVANLAVVVHAEAEQQREGSLHDSRLP